MGIVDLFRELSSCTEEKKKRKIKPHAAFTKYSDEKSEIFFIWTYINYRRNVLAYEIAYHLHFWSLASE